MRMATVDVSRVLWWSCFLVPSVEVGHMGVGSGLLLVPRMRGKAVWSARGSGVYDVFVFSFLLLFTCF
jgi:hypothetical protein